MASLKNHKREEELYNADGIILYNPSNKQEKKIIELLEKTTTLNNGELDMVAGMEVIRYVLKELTKIDNEEIDGMTDEELDETLSSGDSVIDGLVEIMIRLIERIGNKMANSLISQMNELNNMIKITEGFRSLGEFENSYNRLAKANKDLPSFEEFMKMSIISQENEK